MKRATLVLLLLALMLTCGAVVWIVRSGVGPLSQDVLASPRIYAYRDWQSVGQQVDVGDVIHVRAKGEWLYTPGEYHGPEGHATYPAPDTYPVAGASVPGGVLLARIGEDGSPLLVGRGRTLLADRSGLLYFRINDDILSDNEGSVTVELTIDKPTPAP